MFIFSPPTFSLFLMPASPKMQSSNRREEVIKIRPAGACLGLARMKRDSPLGVYTLRVRIGLQRNIFYFESPLGDSGEHEMHRV